MARDVDDVPAVGLFEHVAEAFAGDAVLQDADVGGVALGVDALDESYQGVALAAEVKWLAAVGEAE